MNMKLLADEAAIIASTDKTPAAMAAYLKKEYEAGALAVAEKCLSYFPGRRNAGQAEFWRKVCADIISSQMTMH